MNPPQHDRARPATRGRFIRVLVLWVSIACTKGGPTEPVPLGYGAVVTFANRREIEVGFVGAAGAVLSGTLVLPRDTGNVYPVLVMHFGSDRWTRATYDGSNLKFWIQNDIAVFTWDKRGVGRSQGTCCPWRDPDFFGLLAGDLVAAVRTAKTHQEVDAGKVGAWGFSQGGWIVPLASSLAPQEISWMIIGSGPTVSLGEELLYSELTGDDDCRPSGLLEAEIERRLNERGPSGFDPRPVLGALSTPGYWIYGALDTSIPVARSVRVLDSLRMLGHDYQSIVIPHLNHTWIRDGAMCQGSGPGGIEAVVITSWLWPRLGRSVPASKTRRGL